MSPGSRYGLLPWTRIPASVIRAPYEVIHLGGRGGPIVPLGDLRAAPGRCLARSSMELLEKPSRSYSYDAGQREWVAAGRPERLARGGDGRDMTHASGEDRVVSCGSGRRAGRYMEDQDGCAAIAQRWRARLRTLPAGGFHRSSITVCAWAG